MQTQVTIQNELSANIIFHKSLGIFNKWYIYWLRLPGNYLVHEQVLPPIWES